MKFFDSRLTLSVGALLLSALSGCSVEAGVGAGVDIGDPDAAGTLTVLSSIEGSTSPGQCDLIGATDLELAVYEGSRPVTTVLSDCYNFEVSVALLDGFYNADATLLDANGVPASTTLTLDDLRVVAGTELQIDIDFPASSILP